jgi:fused-like protein
VITSSQSLRILSNLVAAGAINSSGLLDEIIRELLVFTATVVSLKSSEFNDLIAKVYLARFLLEIYGFLFLIPSYVILCGHNVGDMFSMEIIGY